MAQVLKVTDNHDGTSTVEVGTVTWGQAQVVVPTHMLGTDAVEQLYDHAADMGVSAYTTPRVSRRDERRHATDTNG